MATFRTLRSVRLFQALVCIVAFSLAWLQVSPSYGMAVSLRRETARQEAWHLAHPPKLILPLCLTQKYLSTHLAKAHKAMKPGADVRLLSTAEMSRTRGRGAYRNAYFAGAPMPWQRSFRDVNLCDGNLFKSFTDVQVAPGRGAGLVLQRTYNSNDARIGPFGMGWTNAYDIRIQEAADIPAQPLTPDQIRAGGVSTVDQVPRTDFFGHKHTYHRDADGLYSPPPYLYDEIKSDYNTALVNGPTQVMDDTEKGMDGTVKHYINIVTKADGTSGNERACDFIQDRHGNKTTLTYGLSYVQTDGSTRQLLTQVTDPTSRTLTFQWTNFGTTASPAYRITEVDAPTDPNTGQATYRVTYAYYADVTDPNAGGVAYQLKSVTLDPDGLSRTTTYTYTTCGPTDGSGPAEPGLLSSISDPLGHTISYKYSYNDSAYTSGSGNHMWTNTIWVSQITEPSGTGPHTWSIFSTYGVFLHGSFAGGYNFPATEVTDPLIGGAFNRGSPFGVSIDSSLRAWQIIGGDDEEAGYQYTYDNDNNLQEVLTELDGSDAPKVMSYGQHGNLLTENATYGGTVYPHGTTCAYYDASKFFQKASTADGRGLTTAMDYYDDQDASPGNKGEVKWVRDAGYNDSSSPSYQKQFIYTYNQYGQKTSETNLRGVVTRYYYGGDGSSFAQADTNAADTGNLIAVVQDPGTGHLSRTTTMRYDIMGRVLQSTDPAGQISTFQYNTLGQPLQVRTPKTSSAPGETISYVYDTNGRTLSVKDNRGTTYMAYQPGTDLAQSVTDPITGTVGYTYGSWGERRTMTLPGGGTWTYAYLGDGTSGSEGENLPDDQNLDQCHLRLARITDDQGRRIDCSSTHTGALLQAQYNETYDSYGSLAASCTTDYGYDRDLNPIVPYPNYTPSWPSVSSLVALRNNFTLPAYESQDRVYHPGYTRTLNQNTYTYDDDLNRTTNTSSAQAMGANGLPVTDSNNNPVLTSRTEAYTYDKLNRLSTVDYGDGETQSYGFDAMGNRLQKQDSATGTTNSTYDAANRLTSTATNGASASAVTSDADGNTLTDSAGRTMTWDSQNRLTSCVFGGTTSIFKYGADGPAPPSDRGRRDDRLCVRRPDAHPRRLCQRRHSVHGQGDVPARATGNRVPH